MTRSRSVLISLVVFSIAACAPKKKLPPSTPPQPTFTGQATYEGTLPCPRNCEGVKTELTLYFSDRLFELKETYLKTPDGDKAEVSRGEWSELRGHGSDAKAIVYELTSVEMDHERYFLRLGDDALRALDGKGKEILTRQNVVLMRKK